MIPTSIYEVYEDAAGKLFPKHLLKGCESALFLFGAGFYGRNDACWAVEAGVPGTVVDTDFDKLSVMEGIYPDDWLFIRSDAFDFVDFHKGSDGLTWDFISVDCPLDLVITCYNRLYDWRSLSNRAAILTMDSNKWTGLKFVDSGKSRFEYVPRTDKTGWLIMERAGLVLPGGKFYPHSFSVEQLMELLEFINSHKECISMYDSKFDMTPDKIVIRHDVDHSIEQAIKFAEWEHNYGIRSTYFLLPTASYWPCAAAAVMLEDMGHEVGIHNDAMVAAHGKSSYAYDILHGWISEMRAWGITVYGCADHGGVGYVNPSMWGVFTPPDAGLKYEAYHLHRQNHVHYISDNHGKWQTELVDMPDKQTHLLVHPEHWNLG